MLKWPQGLYNLVQTLQEINVFQEIQHTLGAYRGTRELVLTGATHGSNRH